MKGITKKTHWIADYLYVPAVLAAPKLAGFDDDQTASGICQASAVASLGYTLLTDAKWGVVKIIPYKTHAWLDVSMGVAALGAACLLRKSSKQARSTLFAMAVTGLVVGTLSVIGARQRQ